MYRIGGLFLFNRKGRKRSLLLSLSTGATALAVVAGIVGAPGEAFRASLEGLQIWWQNVFPGLLPPLLLAELLAASGLLHGIAAFAEPLTRGLFRLPGAAGWAIAFGWSAGIPAGAKETARLRENGLLRENDVDTALLVSHMPNPFLVVLVIGYGFLRSPSLGWAIAFGLWTATLLTGFAWARIAKPRAPKVPSIPLTHPVALVQRAVRATMDARADDGRPLGKQLADSVTNAVGTLMTLGGLMMMSAVVVRLIQLFAPGNDVWLAFPGLYEMNLGAFESSRSALFSAAPASAAALIAAALAWSGWSGLLQARAAFGNEFPFPWAKVVASRLLLSAVALFTTYGIATLALSEQASGLMTGLLPVSSAATEAWATGTPLPNGWTRLPDGIAVSLASFAVFLLLALAAAAIRPGAPKPPLKPRDEQAPSGKTPPL
ncbi:hypothetical protein ACFPPD_25015 [Cohnella suwonensis]|uniref:Sporulation integral membrane protein YlbJ n=1 Tax=Cohnella suwonensis TaxID=696072 RepID=A0ABW0M1A6_9BACL